jgi:hypothetical protein
VIWKKVFGRFEGEFRSFCVTTPGIVYNNDYTALWYHNYVCWASSLMSVGHTKFMTTFIDWLRNQNGTALDTCTFDARTLYATAFEFTAIGAAVTEM